MKKLILIVALLGLAGCETVDGLGQDISNASRSVKSKL